MRFLCVLGALLALGCGSESSPLSRAAAHTQGSAVVARVNGETIPVTDVQDVLPSARGDRSRAVDLVVTRHLAAAEARKRGLDASPELAAQLEALRREAAAREESLLRDGLFAALRDELVLTDEDLRAQYEKTKVHYSERQLRLRRQAFASTDAARAAGHLDPAASEEVGPAPVAKLPQTVLPEALELREAGERVIVERDGSVALIELAEILPAATVPFEEVREKVEANLRIQRGQQAFAQLLDGLRASAKIEIDQTVLRDDAAWKQAEPPTRRHPTRH